MKGSENANRLINIIDRGMAEPSRAPLLWVGAGLSIPCGYPSLVQLADRLRKVSLAKLPDVLSPIETIDAFVKENGQGDLAEALADIFDRKESLQYHKDLMRLPWKAVITTNYDELLEDALKDVGKQFIKVTLGENLDLTARPEVSIFKIHGDISSFKSMVLSGDSYDKYGQRYGLLERDLESLWRKHHMVYFGCSMTDPRLIESYSIHRTQNLKEKKVFGDPLELIWKNCIFDLCGVSNFYRRMFNIVITNRESQRIKWLE